MRSPITLLGCAVALGFVTASGAAAEEEQQAQPPVAIVDSVDLGTLDCRSVLKMAGDDRADVLLFFHGYLSGLKKEGVVSVNALATSTDTILDHCIDHPADSLLTAFNDARK